MDKLIGSHIHMMNNWPFNNMVWIVWVHVCFTRYVLLYYTGLQLVESMDVEPGLLKASSYMGISDYGEGQYPSSCVGQESAMCTI